MVNIQKRCITYRLDDGGSIPARILNYLVNVTIISVSLGVLHNDKSQSFGDNFSNAPHEPMAPKPRAKAAPIFTCRQT